MAVLLTFLAVLAASYANGAWLLRRMQSAHPSVWVGLRQPALAQSNLASPRLALFKYVWSFRFLKVNDGLFVLSCVGALIAEVGLACLFVLFALAPQ